MITIFANIQERHYLFRGYVRFQTEHGTSGGEAEVEIYSHGTPFGKAVFNWNTAELRRKDNGEPYLVAQEVWLDSLDAPKHYDDRQKSLMVFGAIKKAGWEHLGATPQVPDQEHFERWVQANL